MLGVPTVTIRPDLGGQNRLTRDWDGPAGRKLVRFLNRATTESKQRANVDTGLMRSRIEYRLLPGAPLTGEIVAATNYARWVHDGWRYYPGKPFLRDGVRAAHGL